MNKHLFSPHLLHISICCTGTLSINSMFYISVKRVSSFTLNDEILNAHNYYQDNEDNSSIWWACNGWRFGNDSDKGRCKKGYQLEFEDGDISDKCIVGIDDGESKGKYGAVNQQYPNYSLECQEDQGK